MTLAMRVRVDPPLETKRLILREFAADDFDAVHAYAANSEVCRFMPWGPNSESETRAFLSRVIEAQASEPRTCYDLAVALQKSERVIGGCGLTIGSLEHRRAELGYCLNREYWNQGYATESARAMIDFGLRRLCLHRIYAHCDPDNPSSVRVLEKLGLRREGFLREHQFVKGHWRDAYLYAILEQEWDL